MKPMLKLTLTPSEIPAGTPAELTVQLSNETGGRCHHIGLRLKLPAAMFVVKGGREIKFAQLEAGETAEHKVIVKARKPGLQTVKVLGFAYRGPDGRIHRTREMQFPITCKAGRTVGDGFSFNVHFTGARLQAGEWGFITGRLENGAGRLLESLRVRVTGPLQAEDYSLPALAGGQSTAFRLPVQPQQPGQHPAELQVLSPSGAGLFTRNFFLEVAPAPQEQTGPGGMRIDGSEVHIHYGDTTRVEFGGDAVVVGSTIGTAGAGDRSTESCRHDNPENEGFCVDCGAPLG
jgi:uncharacterized protein (DUF58 family)